MDLLRDCGQANIGPSHDLRAGYPHSRKTMCRLTSGETKVVSSNRNITKDGRVIYCTWYNSVLLDEKWKMVSVFSFVEDYTSRMTAETVSYTHLRAHET